MSWIVVQRDIEAPIDRVFRTVAHIEQFQQAVPHIVKVEFLSDVESGVGCRFRETRLMKGKEAITEVETTAYAANDRVRMVADSHGTVWDTVFAVTSVDGITTLTLSMDARPHKLLPRLINPLIKGMVARAVERDMDLVKEFCEKPAA